MDKELKELLALSRMVKFRTFTVDTLIERNPCLVCSVSITAGAGGAGAGSLIDGFGASDVPFIKLSANTRVGLQKIYWPPLPFLKGIYLDLGSNVDRVELVYIALREGDI